MDFSVEKETATVKVKREFAAPVDKVWAAWTRAELLDQWWAPKPWQARTKVLDFREGGMWLYAMIGPDGSEEYCRADYHAINPKENYQYEDYFCDANGQMKQTPLNSEWSVSFASKGDQTMVDIVIRHKSLEDLETIISMGFREGFTSGMENLDELLAQ
jgi:uncharacterized protein YndB with AHSA1/START domain